MLPILDRMGRNNAPPPGGREATNVVDRNGSALVFELIRMVLIRIGLGGDYARKIEASLSVDSVDCHELDGRSVSA